MEKSIFDLYKDMSNETSSYYEIKIFPDRLFCQDIAESRAKCERFIKRHFDKGKKEQALMIEWSKQYKTEGKHIHSVSTYFLGLTFRRYFDSLLQEQLNRLIPNSLADMECHTRGWYDFRYTWFLTCMYHDIASTIERIKDDLNCEGTDNQILYHYQKIHSYEEMLREFKIHMTPFSYEPSRKEADLCHFPEEIVKNYFDYRISDKDFERDHGIIGGLLLFDKLYKNYRTHEKKHGNGPGNLFITHERGERMLQWRPEHLDHFALIADAVIGHNMWTLGENADALKKQDYEKNGLGSLIVKNSADRLRINEHTLEFMLKFFDTIEPTKRFCDCSPCYILQHIFMRADNHEDDIEFTIRWDAAVEERYSDSLNSWKNSILNMQYWLDVETDGSTPQTVKVLINKTS